MMNKKFNKLWIIIVFIIIAILLAIFFIPRSTTENIEETQVEETVQEPEPTCEEKAINGDFSCFAGKYISNNTGDKEAELDIDGSFPNGIGLAKVDKDSAEHFENDGKPVEVKLNDNNTLSLTYSYYRSDAAWLGEGTTQYEYILIPAGVAYKMHGFDMSQGKSVMKDTDKTKDRIIDTVCDGCYELPIYEKNE